MSPAEKVSPTPETGSEERVGYVYALADRVQKSILFPVSRPYNRAEWNAIACMTVLDALVATLDDCREDVHTHASVVHDRTSRRRVILLDPDRREGQS